MTSPFITLHLDLVNYPCSYVVRSKLSEIVSSLLCANSPSVIQVSDKSFGVFCPPSASTPSAFVTCRKKLIKSGNTCTCKDGCSFASKDKSIAVKGCCLHHHLVFASLQQFSSLDSCTSSLDSISLALQVNPLLLLLPPQVLWPYTILRLLFLVLQLCTLTIFPVPFKGSPLLLWSRSVETPQANSQKTF